MPKQKHKKGFNLVEVIVVIAVIAVILTMVLGVGKHVKDQANIHAAETTLIVLTSALEQYYADQGKMPFETNIPVDEAFVMADFVSVLNASNINITQGTHPDVENDIVATPDLADWSCEALYYFLNKSPNSRSILKTLNESYVSSFNKAGVPLTVDITYPSGVERVIMPRVIDPWGNAYRYRYQDGNTCCRITSAGPDGKFATTGDNITN